PSAVQVQGELHPGPRRPRLHAGPWVTTPLRRPPDRDLTPTQQTVTGALSAARAPVERGVARLKSWRIFRKARCSRIECRQLPQPSSPWSGSAENQYLECPRSRVE